MAFACGIILGLLDAYLSGHGIHFLGREFDMVILSLSPLNILIFLGAAATFAVLSVLSYRFLL